MRIYKYILLVCLTSLLLVSQDNNLNNMYRLGKTFAQSGDYEKAMSIFEDVVELQPWNTTFMEALNDTYIRLKKYDKSIELLQSRIEESPKNVNFYGMLGNTYYTQGDTSKAFDTWEKGLESSDKNVVGYRVIINYALQNRAFGKAIEYLKEGKEATNNHEVFALDLARVYAMTMNFDKAAREFCDIIINDPTRFQMVVNTLSQYLSRATAIEQTIKAAEEVADNNSSKEISRLLIHLYKLYGDFEKAFNFVKKVEAGENGNGREYLKFAQDALNEGKYDVAAAAYKSIVNEYPNSPLVPTSRIGYANTFEKSIDEEREKRISNWKPFGKPEVVLAEKYKEAIDSYIRIAELYPNADLVNEAYFKIAQIYYDKLDKVDSAAFYFQSILNTNPNSSYAAQSKLKLAEIEIRSDKLNEAELILKEFQEKPRVNESFTSEVNLLLGKLYFWKGEYKVSSGNLTKVTNNLFDDNANDALKLLTLVSTLQNDSTNLSQFAEAELLLYQNNFNRAAELFNSLSENQNLIISEFSKLRHSQALIALDRYNDALAILGEASKLGMFAADAQYLMGEIKLYALKDYQGALKEYRTVLENYSNSLYFDKSREKIEYINELENKTI